MAEKPVSFSRKGKQLSYEDRLKAVHLSRNHGLQADEIAQIIGKSDTCIRHILDEYRKYGRVNKLLTTSAKRLIL